MNEAPPTDDELPEELFRRGWRQGVVFRAQGASILVNHEAETDSDSTSFERRHFDVSPDDLLVLATQTCDLVADLASEPLVEALRCQPVSHQRLGELGKGNSRRYFVVDAATSLVAYAPHRVLLNKRALWFLTPVLSLDSAHLEYRFSKWLGRRFSAAAINDEVVNHFERPLAKRLDELKRAASTLPTVTAFWDLVEQVRVRYVGEALPLRLTPVLLVKGLALTEDQDRAVADTIGVVSASSDPSRLVIAAPEFITRESVSVADFERTMPLNLDHYTYKGQEVIGAEPPSAD